LALDIDSGLKYRVVEQCWNTIPACQPDRGLSAAINIQQAASAFGGVREDLAATPVWRQVQLVQRAALEVALHDQEHALAGFGKQISLGVFGTDFGSDVMTISLQLSKNVLLLAV
jgi:hypothetical protein